MSSFMGRCVLSLALSLAIASEGFCTLAVTATPSAPTIDISGGPGTLSFAIDFVSDITDAVTSFSTSFAIVPSGSGVSGGGAVFTAVTSLTSGFTLTYIDGGGGIAGAGNGLTGFLVDPSGTGTGIATLDVSFSTPGTFDLYLLDPGPAPGGDSFWKDTAGLTFFDFTNDASLLPTMIDGFAAFGATSLTPLASITASVPEPNAFLFGTVVLSLIGGTSIRKRDRSAVVEG